MRTFNSVQPPTSKFVEGEPDNDGNIESVLTPQFPPPTSSSAHPTNFQRESSPETLECRDVYSPPHFRQNSVGSFPQNLKWSDRSIVSPVDSAEELLWPCRTRREDSQLVEKPGKRCSIPEARRWGESAHYSNVTPKHEDQLEVQTGHYRWSEPSSLLRTYRRPVDYRPFQETITGQSHWTEQGSQSARRSVVRKGFPLASQPPRRLFPDPPKDEHEGYDLLNRYSPELNPIRRPAKLPQGRPWRDSCEFSPEIFPHLTRNRGNLSEKKSSSAFPRLSLLGSHVEKSGLTEQSCSLPSKSAVSVPACTPVKKVKDNSLSQPPPRPRAMQNQGRDVTKDDRAKHKPKLYSVFWRKDYNLKKKAGKNEVVTRTRVIKRGGKFAFEKCEKLKRDPKTKKYCFVFTIPPGPAAKFMIYVMANRYKESCELQRRYNCWLHIDLLFNTEDLLQEYEGLVTLKWQNDTHVYSLARRILEIINTKLKGINVVAIDPPLKARTQIRDKLLHMSSKLIKRVRTELRCFFHIVLLPEENVTRIIVGGLNKQRLEKGLKEILQVINPEIQKKYNGDGFVIREVGGEVKLALEVLSSFKK